MVKYLSFHNSSSFALRDLLMWMARPQCDTPPLCFYWVALAIVKRLHIGIGFVLDPWLGMFVCLLAGSLPIGKRLHICV
jgi:hypothetical protein